MFDAAFDQELGYSHMTTFSYLGHETVGAYVARQLGAIGWSGVDDVQSADVVLTYFTHASALEDAYFEEDGIIKNARKGTLLVDLSPSTLSVSREISAVATVNGFNPVEAPLAILDATLEDAFAMRENFVCFVSADDECFERAHEALERLAGIVKRCGASGTAQLAKASHTMQYSAQFMAAVEAEALVRAALEANEQLLAVESSSIIEPLSDVISTSLPAIEELKCEGTYTVELMMADVVAAMTVADDASAVLPHLESTLRMLEMLALIGGADMSPAALTLLFRDEGVCSKFGLDWSRVEGLYVEGHEPVHNHDLQAEFEQEYGDFNIFDGTDEEFDFGGFGVYSEK